jgi:hypothetical protein
MLNDRLRAVTRKRTLLFLLLSLSVAGGFLAGRHKLTKPSSQNRGWAVRDTISAWRLR